MYGLRVSGVDDGDSRSGGRIKVLMTLSALEVRRLVPSGDLKSVSKYMIWYGMI